MISKLSRISAIAACVTTALAVALPGRATTTAATGVDFSGMHR